MTAHGIVEIRTNSLANYAHYGEIYVSLCNFLSSSQAQSIGISRIAYNKGAAANGTGLDYPGTANSVGNNAWSVWCWTSASIPFYMLLQEATGSGGFNASPGTPGAYIGTQGVGVSFAYHGDGTSPWNGTTNNNGSDTKGTIVWQTGSAVAPSGTLYVFPRANSGGGANAATRNYQSTVVGWDGLAALRTHLLCDENNVLFLSDYQANSSYSMNFFGKVKQRPGADPMASYVQIASYLETGASYGMPLEIDSRTYGNTTYNQQNDGGIAYPWSESKISGSMGTYPCVLSELFSTTFQPNLTTQPYSYDVIPLELLYNETPRYGYAGSIDFFKMIYGVATHDTNAILTSASFGDGPATSIYKIVAPWDGTTVPGSGNSRTGSIF